LWRKSVGNSAARPADRAQASESRPGTPRMSGTRVLNPVHRGSMAEQHPTRRSVIASRQRLAAVHGLGGEQRCTVRARLHAAAGEAQTGRPSPIVRAISARQADSARAVASASAGRRASPNGRRRTDEQHST